MKYLIYVLPLLLLFTDCTDSETSQEEDLLELENLSITIKELANSSICGSEYECAYIGFGSKPCGGNWSYLVYSTSIDTDLFFAKVEEYNLLEMEYNAKWGIFSDCMVPLPPDSVTCENGKCVANYN